MTNRSIFIHSMFRTGSTYIWNKFRDKQNYKCYYEPLHQIMSEISTENIDKALTHDYESVKHPNLNKHYLEEYYDVVDEKVGIPFFRKEFSFEQFCDNGENQDLKKYIDNLLEKAVGEIPVLQFNRTALRSFWFKQNYPDSLNIYLFRNPRDQFNSYYELEKRAGSNIFFVMDLLIAGKNRKEKIFEKLSEYIELLDFRGESIEEEIFFYSSLSQIYSDSEKYFIFYYIWLVSLIENVFTADILIDINLLSSSELYKQKLNDSFKKRNINILDLSDSNIKNYKNYNMKTSDMEEIEFSINQLVINDLSNEKKSKLLPYVKKSKSVYISTIGNNLTGTGPQKKVHFKKGPNIKELFLQDLGKKGFFYYKTLNAITNKKNGDDLDDVLIDQQKRDLEFERVKDDFAKLKNTFSIEKRSNEAKYELLISQVKKKEDQINLKQVEYGKVCSELDDIKREMEIQKIINTKLELEFEKKDKSISKMKEKCQKIRKVNKQLEMEEKSNDEVIEDVNIYIKNVQLILKSWSYKTGRILTFPLRKVRNIVKKSRKDEGGKKKLAFIDHSFHKKSLATDFLKNILMERFEVHRYWDESWNDGPKANIFKLANKGFKYVVFFQSYNYSKEELKLLEGINITLIPMYDGSAHLDIEFWKKYRKAKILNFSRTLHKKLLKYGLNTNYFQYFIDTKMRKSMNYSNLRGFFWQRQEQIAWEDIRKLVGDTKFEGFHIHKALDPAKDRSNFKYPKKKDVKYFRMTFSDWFDTKAAYLRQLKKYNVFFVPRLYEGIGMSFLDAMALGMCVVAPDNPTMNEYITHGVTGLLYDKKNLKPLDFSNAEKIGENAKEYIAKGRLDYKSFEKDILNFIEDDKQKKFVIKFFWNKIKFTLRSRIRRLLKKK